MTASFKKIDYSLRPAKHAERRMLCDVFRRLRPFGLIEDYVYIGFGSIWFADFSLFHRSLGIKNMISIEHVETARERIEENKPFRIPVDYRASNEVLPELDWSKKNFIWMDYDDPLSTSMLSDMRVLASHAGSGTVLAVSVQCTKALQLAEAEKDKNGSPTGIARFFDLFGRSRVPPDTKEDDLYGWRLGNLSRKLLFSEIETALAIRNSQNAEAEMSFQPICEIEYEDGAKMTTIVGIFHSPADAEKVAQCHFESLDFIPSPLVPIRIKVPKLTIKEFKKLESQLPLMLGGTLNLGTIPAVEAKQYSSMYRYLPNFAVLEG
jgi:hypothetical protein